MDWLDTETKALLQASPPEILAPPATEGFTLILLANYGHEHHLLVCAMQRATQTSLEEAERILRSRFQ